MNFNIFDSISMEKNEILNNKAGILGGGLYSISLNETLNSSMMNFIDNSVNSVNDNYASKPSYISLNTDESTLNMKNFNITSGDVIYLLFSLHDEYKNVINDITKYYSNLSIRVILEENNDININKRKETDEENTYITGNICTFMNGKKKKIIFKKLNIK